MNAQCMEVDKYRDFYVNKTLMKTHLRFTYTSRATVNLVVRREKL